MTDTAILPTATTVVPRRLQAAPSRRLWFVVTVLLSVGAVVLSASSTVEVASRADAELVMLLRFMAAIKAAMAVAALGLIAWRLGYAASAMMTLAYTFAGAAMAAAPVLIWQLAHVAVGAMLFHAGLIVLFGAAWMDRDDVAMMVAGRGRKWMLGGQR